MHVAQALRDVFGLPQGERAFAGGDAERCCGHVMATRCEAHSIAPRIIGTAASGLGTAQFAHRGFHPGGTGGLGVHRRPDRKLDVRAKTPRQPRTPHA